MHDSPNAGEGRNVDDPANLDIMASISRGECPRELEPPSRDTPITVNLVRHHGPYTAPAAPVRPAYVAFRGTGRTLAGVEACVHLNGVM